MCSATSPQCNDVDCTCFQGQNFTISVTFLPTAVHSTTEMFFSAQTTPGGPFLIRPIPSSDPCLQIDPGCPTVPGQLHTIDMDFPILPENEPFTRVNFEGELP
jgi:hypothetical protein